MHIDSHFDSGNIEVVELLDNNTANLRIQMDAGDEHMQWFHFRVDGAKGKDVSLRIVNAGEASYPKAWNGYRVCTSVDRQTWTRVDTTFEDGVLTIVIDVGTTATYSVSWGDESVQGEVELEFETFQPNGEGCDPICFTAAHTIELFRSFEE